MAITRARKEELVQQYSDLLDESNGFVVVHYSGLTVNTVYDLRGAIREAEGKYLVTKNTLFTLALQNQGWPVPDDLLQGPTAVAFGMENMPGVAKAVFKFIQDGDLEEKLTVTGGIMAGEVISAAQVDMVSKLPTLDELRAQLAGLIVQPAQGLVNVVYAATGQVVNVLQAFVDDRGDGDAA